MIELLLYYDIFVNLNYIIFILRKVLFFLNEFNVNILEDSNNLFNFFCCIFLFLFIFYCIDLVVYYKWFFIIYLYNR